MKDVKNSSSALAFSLRVVGLRGDSYFTRFEVVRVMKLAACKLEKAQSCMKNDYLRLYPHFSIYFILIHKRAKNPLTPTTGCGLFIPSEFLQR